MPDRGVAERPRPAAPLLDSLGCGSGERLVDAAGLLALTKDIFLRVGVPEDEADIVADALVQADLRGMQSHGVLRVLVYTEKIRAGGMRPGRKGRVVRETVGTVLLDGEDGLGHVLTVAAMDRAIEKSQAGRHRRGRRLQQQPSWRSGLFRAARCPARQDRHGCDERLAQHAGLGRNDKDDGPLAVHRRRSGAGRAAVRGGCGARGHQPRQADLHGGKGENIPPGWGVDRNAQPTDDPAKVFDGGWILPIGGHKGFGIKMFIEILSGVLTGALVGTAIRDLYNAPRGQSQGLGHFCIAIDPEAFMPVAHFKKRMDEMIRMIKSNLVPGTERMIIPGQLEFERETQRRRHGIPLNGTLVHQLQQLGRDLGSPLTI